MQRRDFLRATGTGLLGLSRARRTARPGRMGLAAPGSSGASRSPVVVVIFLRGGCDALNTLVPYAEDRYYEMRPTHRHPAGGRRQARACPSPGRATSACIPPWRTLKPLYEKDSGAFAPIVNVGSPHPTRSHFDAQDFMEYAAPGLRTPKRLAQPLPGGHAFDARDPSRSCGPWRCRDSFRARCAAATRSSRLPPEGDAEVHARSARLFDDLYLREGRDGRGEEEGPAVEEEAQERAGGLGDGRGCTIRTLRRYLEILEESESRRSNGVRVSRRPARPAEARVDRAP